jgi:hypothetical protein
MSPQFSERSSARFDYDEVIFMTGLQPPTDCNHL